ncbi:MAG: hypothetical protein M1819_001942 [Sarea resinae]|nr:MAG: hypothetical protein M1819_001942 [Sarea resinae]
MAHGGASDGHTHDHDSLHAAEEGRGHHTPFSVPDEDSQVADESGNIADVLPQNRIGGGPRTNISGESTVKVNRTRPRGFSRSDEDDSTAAGTSPAPTYASASVNGSRRHRRHTSSSRSRGFSSVDDIHIHPASLRNEIIAAGRLEDIESATGTESECEESVKSQDEEAIEATEGSPLLGSTKKTAASKLRRASMLSTHSHHSHHSHNRGSKHGSWHIGHKHNAPKEESSPGGHSHHDLNMRGVFLHVMGDALGNIGVIGSALIIWLTPYWWRFYSDPLISLVITVIILASAIPLCKAASRILLQAAPAGISVDDIKEDIEELPGIFSCHHLHVWQLSDTKLVASLHVQVEFDFKGEGSARYMELAQAIRTCLHDYGIRSSTIQPEFCLNSEHDHTASGSPSNSIDAAPGYLSIDGHQSKSASKHASREGSVKANACLLECGGDCADGSQCCAPGRSEDGDHSDHGHNHSH